MPSPWMDGSCAAAVDIASFEMGWTVDMDTYFYIGRGHI